MTDSQKLHTAARRYCMEQWSHWASFYSQVQHRSTGSYTDQELAIFPRYVLLEAIALEVERFDFEALPPLLELRELLVLAAQIATSFSGESQAEIARQAEQQTRSEFARFIENFNVALSVNPLPYRRVLFGDELQIVRNSLEKHWGVSPSNHFYPLREARSANAPTECAYNAAAFEAAFPTERLAALLRARGIHQVYELREFGAENYVEEVEIMEPSYTGAEVFIFSLACDWLFYASHEASITTAGWLTQAVQDAWPEWEESKYKPNW